MSSEIKAISDIVKRLSDIFKITIPFETVRETIIKFYDKGLEEMEVKFQMNFTRNNSQVDLLTSYVSENIKGMNKEMMEKIRKEITQGAMNLESIPKISKRIEDIAKVSKNRAMMIARTETNRALNMGHKDAAVQSGIITKKQWVSHIDNRTSPICVALNGTTIGLNDKFRYQGQEWDLPPAHVNCRSRVIYLQE
jgi:SPP1 gp7 family putative phage head morphogenesis protein